MVKAIVFFDLDGTLLNAQTKLDEEVIAAVQQLKTNDILPVIATGRNIFEIRTVIQQTQIDTLVSANGSYVVANGKPVHTAALSKDVIGRLAKLIADNHDAYAVLNQNADRINRMTDTVKKTYHYINSPIPIIDPTFWHLYPVHMMLILTTPEHDALYQRAFKGELAFYRQTPYSIDVVAPDSSKQAGIQHLLALADYQNIPTYAFGDGNNDLPMFQTVDHAIAMANGLDTVKQAAEFVTTANTDHGIVNGLKHYHLI